MHDEKRKIAAVKIIAQKNNSADLCETAVGV